LERAAGGGGPADLDALFAPEAAAALRAAFSGLRVTVGHVAAEGDHVAACGSWSGTRAATGEPTAGTTIHAFRVAGGRIVEAWADVLAWGDRPGAAPPTGRAAG
jgi:hypothetical protein